MPKTNYAQDELGDVIFVELAEIGDHADQGELFGLVESIKAMADLYSPVSGGVLEVNDTLEDQPELVNQDLYGGGWIIEGTVEDETELDDLLSAAEYRERVL